MSDASVETKTRFSKNTMHCSFCGKSQHEIRKMIAGPTSFICNECIVLCADILVSEGDFPLTQELLLATAQIRLVQEGKEITEFPPDEANFLNKYKELILIVEPTFFDNAKANWEYANLPE